jgi:hypothetical protein
LVEISHVLIGPNGAGLGGIEIVAGTTKQVPTRDVLTTIYHSRRGKRNVDVVVALSHGGNTWVFGPDSGRAPLVLAETSAERQLQVALNEPNSLLAYRRLTGIQEATASTDMPGVINHGLFATYHLRENVARAKEFPSWNGRAQPLVSLRHRELITQLGYSVTPGTSNSFLLTVMGEEPRAVALLLEQDESFDSASARFHRSPVAMGLSAAAQARVPWLILLRGDQIRLYPAKDNVGVGQKGQVETYLELDLATVSEHHIGFLPLIFSAESLTSDGATDRLLADSAKFATALGVRLRERVYGEVVPALATEVAHQLRGSGRELDSDALDFAYRTTLTILFRLLFQAYAEDRGLLPAGRNEAYDANSLKTLGSRLLGNPDQEFGEASAIWRNLKEVWNSIDKGNPQYELPAYNGGLFATDEARHAEGAYIERLDIPDTVMGPALRAMLIDASDDGVPGLVDFRSLSVREFGTIYEGLLESSLSLADQDLTLDEKRAWVPAEEGHDVLVDAGDPFFHNSSGERKATGSYFTPSFIVDHLIERAIDPTLDRHLERIRGLLGQGKSHEAARDFFDYRVADLAMGSGHFLVAAVDRIEAKMRDFLADPTIDIPGVHSELLRLAQAAKEALGRDEVAYQDIEQATLLRRQIARRCVYGIDINVLAVELSRLALWIHTFVPGLPMSTLDHNLVCANSLTGIGTVDEAKKVLDFDEGHAGQVALFGSVVDESLEKARDILLDVANASEATKAEAAEVRQRLDEARIAAEPTRKIFDAAVAVRTRKAKGKGVFSEAELVEIADSPEVRELIRQTNPAHMPYLFPEVFLRDNGGFDALVGNPPWEKVKVEEHQWWGTQIPGLRGMPQHQRNLKLAEFRAKRPDLEARFTEEVEAVSGQRAILLSGPFEGLGKGGDPDLYQAFSWRNWQLVRPEGRFGLVLPRGALSGSAMSSWRKEILQDGCFVDVCFATNSNHWLFESVHPQYTVALTVVARVPEGRVRFAGPFHSRKSFEEMSSQLLDVEVSEFRSWSKTAGFPLLPSAESAEVFRQCQSAPRFGDQRDDFELRPFRELDAANDRHLFSVDPSHAADKIRVLAGSSFNLWNPGAGEPYGYAEPLALRAHLQAKLRNAVKSPRSAFSSLTFEPGVLPMDSARIAFRDVTNQTNTRTTIVCLLPPGSSATHKAPVLVRRRGNPSDEAFVLGVMSSVPFDWGARRVVELTLSFEILNTLPVPFASSDSILRERVVSLSGRLAAVDSRFSTWAAAVGVPVGSVKTKQEKEELIYELDALVSLLYGLKEEQVIHVFETFHRGWDYEPRLQRVLDYYRQWKENA